MMGYARIEGKQIEIETVSKLKLQKLRTRYKISNVVKNLRVFKYFIFWNIPRNRNAMGCGAFDFPIVSLTCVQSTYIEAIAFLSVRS
jgi:hypothetical protein